MTVRVIGLFGFMVAAILIAPFIGMNMIHISVLWDAAPNDMDATVFWNIRVPRTLTAALCGAALAISGMAFQAMLRNPLAAPFTLGVSSGAALGAAVYVRLGLSFALLGVAGISVAAFLGATLAMLMVYGLTRLRGGFNTATLLLGGVAISFSLSSLILFIQYTASPYDSFRLIRWMMGGFGLVGYESVLDALPFTVVGVAVLAMLGNELNLITLGDDLAMSRGVEVNRIRKILFFVISLTVGGVVAVCGPVGFVGIMVPHICRFIVGRDHRHLMPACACFGAAFLLICDAVSRTIIAPAELPVGVITALLGGPFFLWLLLTRRRGIID